MDLRRLLQIRDIHKQMIVDYFLVDGFEIHIVIIWVGIADSIQNSASQVKEVSKSMEGLNFIWTELEYLFVNHVSHFTNNVSHL